MTIHGIFDPLAILVAAGLIATGPAAAAAAKPDPDVSWERVGYADLDLDTDSGAKAAFRRIRLAAHAVCPDEPEEVFDYNRQRHPCLMQAIDRAVDGLGAPRVAAVRQTYYGLGPSALASARR